MQRFSHKLRIGGGMEKFKNIDEELTWTMFKMSDGNPYLIHEIVKVRNIDRERNKGKEI